MITKVTPCYTGGNITVFTGSLDDGTYFIADDANYDVRVLDVDPDALGDEVWYEDTQMAHLVRDIPEDEVLDFFREMLVWVITEKPEGNYSEYDIEQDLEEIAELGATPGWR